MKALLVLLGCLAAASLQAEGILVAADLEGTNIAFIRFQIRTDSGEYIRMTQFPATEGTVTNRLTGLVIGATNYISATAVDAQGVESEPSPELVVRVPDVLRPPTLRLIITGQASLSLDGQWTNLTQVVVPVGTNRAFYRAMVELAP